MMTYRVEIELSTGRVIHMDKVGSDFLKTINQKVFHGHPLSVTETGGDICEINTAFVALVKYNEDTERPF